MTDPHLNVFHAYRGPSRSEDAAVGQLEDNVTRALLIAVDHARNSREIRQALFRALGLSKFVEVHDYHCHLQIGQSSESWPTPAARRLLIIHGGPELSISRAQESTRSGRLDGLIVSSRFLLGIEAKLGNVVDEAQISRHCELLGIDRSQVTEFTWSQIARELRNIPNPRATLTTASFLLEQLRGYLEMIGFGGFTADHFAYFALPQSARDDLVKNGIRRILDEHGKGIAQTLGPEWKPHVLNIHPDIDATGVVIERGDRGREPHVTVSIDAAKLAIFANVELSRSFRRFARRWSESPGTLIGFLRDLGREQVTGPTTFPWKVGVKRRVRLGRPRHYHYWDAIDVALNVVVDWPDELLKHTLDRFFAQPDGEDAPEIMILRSYPAAVVLEEIGISEWLGNDAKRLKPFFSWLEMN